MKQPALFAAIILLVAVVALPAGAQVVAPNGQSLSTGQTGTTRSTLAPITGTFCIEEMTATFCNVITGPNINGYGSRSTAGSSSSAGSASLSASGGTAGIRSSIPSCSAEPPFNELCD